MFLATATSPRPRRRSPTARLVLVRVDLNLHLFRRVLEVEVFGWTKLKPEDYGAERSGPKRSYPQGRSQRGNTQGPSCTL
jgi:hypothetical protein